MRSFTLTLSGAPLALNSRNEGVRSLNSTTANSDQKAPSRSSNNTIIPIRYVNRHSCIISMSPSLIIPKITRVYSKIPRVISDKMESYIRSSISSTPAPGPKLKPKPPPQVLIIILKSNQTIIKTYSKSAHTTSFQCSL